MRSRSQFTIVDENFEDPFVDGPAYSTRRSGPVKVYEVDLENENETGTPSRKRRAVAKRIPLSPTKINQQFRVTKFVSGMSKSTRRD